MRCTWHILMGLGLFGCASDDSSNGVGNGNDTLPKRGELASDPTIVSATARCSACAYVDCFGSDPPSSHIRVRVDASDPMGASNLGTCAGALNMLSDQDGYDDGNECNLFFKTPCMAGTLQTFGITVSNSTGGVTTASIALTIVP